MTNLQRERQAAPLDDLMDALGPIWARDIVGHSRQVIEAYTHILRNRPGAALAATRDVPYGPDVRQRLDVFGTPGLARAPIAVFVHGGAFVRGQKDPTDEVYANVPRYFARRGWLGVNVEYRLAPGALFPAGADDVDLALQCVRRHAQGWGGDAGRIVLIGHSAGGAHAATFACDPVVGPREGPGIRALVLIGARVRADTRADNPNAEAVRAYFGPDDAVYGERSPVTHAGRATMPVLVAIAEFENPHLDAYGREFFDRVSCRAGSQDRFLKLLGHNHTSAVAHLGSADEAFGRALLAFCHDVGIAGTADVAMPDVATPAGAHGVELQS